jgi:hypothetical protein
MVAQTTVPDLDAMAESFAEQEKSNELNLYDNLPALILTDQQRPEGGRKLAMRRSAIFGRAAGRFPAALLERLPS